MAKKFAQLHEKMRPEARARAEALTRKILAEMPLQELRTARSFTQKELAQVLRVEQASISKLERRADMYISTLRRYIKAMGGELEITATFAEGEVRINQFEDLQDDDARPGASAD